MIIAINKKKKEYMAKSNTILSPKKKKKPNNKVEIKKKFPQTEQASNKHNKITVQWLDSENSPPKIRNKKRIFIHASSI